MCNYKWSEDWSTDSIAKARNSNRYPQLISSTTTTNEYEINYEFDENESFNDLASYVLSNESFDLNLKETFILLSSIYENIKHISNIKSILHLNWN